MWFLGIDWAEKHLDYCLENQSGDVMLRGRIANDDGGFHNMLNAASKQQTELTELAVAIESPHEHVVDFLVARGVSVYPVNAKAIHDYRKSRKLSGSKSDAADAELIASYLREHHKALKAWCLPEPQLRELQMLLADRDKLITEKVRLQNQLRSTLRDYFPQAIAAFNNLTCPVSLEFLTQFPTPDAIQANTEQDWLRFIVEHHIFNPKSRQRFLAAVKQKPIEIDESIVAAKSLLTKSIVSQLKPIIAALAQYYRRIQQLLEDFEDGVRFQSIPGVNVILSSKLLVAIGTDRERFTSANELQSLFGTAPYTSSSGQYRSVQFRHACNKKMRSALHQMAFASLLRSTWANTYFARKRREGKRGHHALRCLANQWLKVIFAVWKTETIYDETKHLASIARHQLNQHVAG